MNKDHITNCPYVLIDGIRNNCKRGMMQAEYLYDTHAENHNVAIVYNKLVYRSNYDTPDIINSSN